MSFLVEAARTIAYARATNDPLPEHLNGELAPPVFAVVPAWEALVEAMAGVIARDRARVQAETAAFNRQRAEAESDDGPTGESIHRLRA